MRTWFLGLAAFLAVGLSPLLALAAHQGLSIGEPVLVISAPWREDAADVIRRAGLQEISPERAPFGALTALSDASEVERLKNNGAWFVVDGRLVAQLCAE